jgi:hypothetical protein
MKLKITTTYNHYTTPDNDKMICKFYLINNIPFTFDECEKLQVGQYDPAIIALADISYRYSAEDLFRASNYLILEEAHPLLFDVDLENPELLPVD